MMSAVELAMETSLHIYINVFHNYDFLHPSEVRVFISQFSEGNVSNCLQLLYLAILSNLQIFQISEMNSQ